MALVLVFALFVGIAIITGEIEKFMIILFLIIGLVMFLAFALGDHGT